MPNLETDPFIKQKTTGGNNSSSMALIVVLAVLLLIVIGVTVWIYITDSQKIEQMNSTMEEKTEALKKLSEEKDVLQKNLDELMILYPASRDSIQALKSLLSERENQIRSLINRGARLDKALQEVSRLSRINEDLEAQVKQLKEENISLAERNRELESELTKVREDLVGAINNKPSPDGPATDGSGQPPAAPHLNSADLAIKTFKVHPKDPTQAKEDTKAANVKRLKVEVSYTSSSNLASGSQTLFLQIIGPNQSSIGSIIGGNDATTGISLQFAAEKEINYMGSNGNTQIVYDHKGTFKKGRYVAAIWHNGYKIGSGNFSLN